MCLIVENRCFRRVFHCLHARCTVLCVYVLGAMCFDGVAPLSALAIGILQRITACTSQTKLKAEEDQGVSSPTFLLIEFGEAFNPLCVGNLGSLRLCIGIALAFSVALALSFAFTFALAFAISSPATGILH